MAKKIDEVSTLNNLSKEISQYLDNFQIHFLKRNNIKTLISYLQGLLSKHHNKNSQTMAEILPETNGQQLNNLLTGLIWNEWDLNYQRIQLMQKLSGTNRGILIIDETDFIKEGFYSVGVLRQYSKRLDAIVRCQILINSYYLNNNLGWPISTILYLPTEWFINSSKHAAAAIPLELKYQTRDEITLQLLDYAAQPSLQPWLTVIDVTYNSIDNIIDQMENPQRYYCVAIKEDFIVIDNNNIPLRADQLFSHGKPIDINNGSLIQKKIQVGRCWRFDNANNLIYGWLICKTLDRKSTKSFKYYWSNLPDNTSIKAFNNYLCAHQEIKKYYNYAQNELGWDHYQGRLWKGFYRHTVLVMLADSFIKWRKYR